MTGFPNSNRRVLGCVIVPCLLALPALADSPAKKTDKPEKPAASSVARPSWGKVMGWVVDASTRKPISGARVAVEVDGAFPESGRATDDTDAGGKFVAKAPLGKISSKFDWGRLITMHPISLLMGPSTLTKKTKLLDVSEVNVRVEAAGYKPFVGRVRATLADPLNFAITLDDVWLAPEREALVSFTPENLRLEAVESLTVDPPVAAPGQKVRVTLVSRLPVERGSRYHAYANGSSIRLIEHEIELKRPKQKDTAGGEDPDRVIFTGEATLPKSSVDKWAEVTFYLIRNGDTVLRKRDTKALLQVVKTDEERDAAAKVQQGYERALLGDKEGALRLYGEARKAHPDYALAHLFYGNLCLQLNRPEEAAEAYQRLVDLDPRDYETARARHAFALIESGKFTQALTDLADAEKVYGKRPVPSLVALCRARVYAAQGNFEQADQWLTKAGADIQIPEEIQTEINLKRMDAAVRSKPDDPDLRLSYARVLRDARRSDAAIQQIRKAAALDPAQPWAFIDLGTTLWDLGRRDDGLANLQHAVKLAPENPEALLALAGALRDLRRYADALPLYRKVTDMQRMNLRARHNYALMLYATGDPARARSQFVDIVTQARAKGDLVDDGLFGGIASSIYFGAKRRYAAGFTVPEAAADMAILEALQDLDKHPDSALLYQNIGSALLDLEMPALAAQALEKAHGYDPSLLETRFLLGKAYRMLGQADHALGELKAVVAANPLHPLARLELAQLYTDRGDLDQAQAQLLAHAKNYPYQRPPRPTQSLGG